MLTTDPFEWGYALHNRVDFAKLAPKKLLERANKYQGNWVLWDPQDDEQGFLLVGDKPDELIKEWFQWMP